MDLLSDSREIIRNEVRFFIIHVYKMYINLLKYWTCYIAVLVVLKSFNEL